MKKLKVSLGALALMLGMGAAFATTHHQTLDKKWGLNRSTGMYEEVTGLSEGTDYACTDGDDICTAQFPADVNPNDQDNDQHAGTAQPTNVRSGIFGN